MKFSWKIPFILAWFVVVYALWFYDAAREHHLKKKLGSNYEES